MGEHLLDTEEDKREMNLPVWAKVCIIVSTVSTTVTSIALVALLIKAGPPLTSLAHEVSTVFDGMNIPDLNLALRQAVFVLDAICQDLVDCSANS